jgi:hypothetical protein
MNKSKIYIEVLIEGFEMSCNELTKLFGIEPTECEEKGTKFISKIDKKEHILEISNWSLDSGIKPNKSLEEIIRGLLKKLRPYKNRIIPICKIHRPYFGIIMHIYGNEYPEISWENDIIIEIAEYNASMGIDLSVFPEE